MYESRRMASLPNLILIGIDNLRADLVSSFPDKTLLQDFLVDDRVPETATLDTLARESFWFRTCVSAAGYTPPSFATTFTGTYPYHHGVVDFIYSRLRSETRTLFEMLRAAGYRTAWFGREEWLLSTTQITRGIEAFCRNEDELFEFTAAHQDEPLCLFAHFFDCHKPFMWTEYDRPGINEDFFLQMHAMFGEDLRPLQSGDWKNLVARAETIAYEDLPDGVDPQEHYGKLVELYLRAIAKFDAGRLADFLTRLQEKNLWNSSYTLTFSDHGEIRDPEQRHRTNHGYFTSDAQTRVVCMLRGPDIQPGVSDELVGLVDMAPTLLNVLGSSAKPVPLPAFDGRSLSPILRGQSLAYEKRWYMQEGWMVFTERAVPPTRRERAVRTPEGFRYVFRGNPADLALAEEMDTDELPKWLAHTFFPMRWDAEAERDDMLQAFQRAGGDYDAALTLLFWKEHAHTRYAIYDLHTDPFERHPIRVSYAPDTWEDYLEKYRWMLAHSGACSHPEADTLSEENDDAELTERLRALGYHD